MTCHPIRTGGHAGQADQFEMRGDQGGNGMTKRSFADTGGAGKQQRISRKRTLIQQSGQRNCSR